MFYALFCIYVFGILLKVKVYMRVSIEVKRMSVCRGVILPSIGKSLKEQRSCSGLEHGLYTGRIT